MLILSKNDRPGWSQSSTLAGRRGLEDGLCAGRGERTSTGTDQEGEEDWVGLGV